MPGFSDFGPEMVESMQNIIVTGGYEANYVVGFAKGLAANGIDICVDSCDDSAGRLDAAGIANVNLRGSVAEGRRPSQKLVTMCVYYARLMLLLWGNRGATVHFIGSFRDEMLLWEGIFLNLWFRVTAGRYLYTVHNVLPHRYRESRFFRMIYRWIYAIPDRLLVHTDLAGEQLTAEFGVPEEKIQITSIGLNEEIPQSDLTVAQARERLGVGTEDPCILFFGKIIEYKGLDLLLSAFDLLPISNVSLIIAGAFRSRAYRSKILAQLDGMARRCQVRFHDRFIPNEEVEVFFKASTVFCLPYRHICQSGMIFLAPAFGVPMVTTDVGALREFVDGKLGIVCRGDDAASLAEALSAVLREPDRFSRAMILEHGRKYCWKEVCRELVPLYIARPPRAAQPVVTPANEKPARAFSSERL
jgi:glycosyltransferase involved in cell wall biosynthesis